jgi:putative hemolysin
MKVKERRPDLKFFTLDMLPKELTVPVVPIHVEASEFRAGRPIDVAKLRGITAHDDRIAYLRWRISLLAEYNSIALPAAGRCEPFVPAISPEVMEFELNSLGAGSRLASHGDLEVILARSTQIPNTLREIGRLREITFRAAGEGTGRAFDLDPFDQHYLQLFVWNSVKREIAGGYRLATTSNGVECLYTATLFHYGPEFLGRIGPALELGRSFIRPEYQRSFAPLLLLWKGIGKYVAAHPCYKTLFGPVSISNQYSALSRELMIAFLEKREWLSGLADLVRPRSAPARRASAEYCRDLDDLSDIVSDLESGVQGVPVLLRQYLKLGGKLLGFNVDPDFSNALDGLILVDLTRTEPRLLERYLGKPEAHSFLSYWKGSNGTV